MDAAELLRRNELDAALAKLLDQVRADPADAKYRVFLFQLSCVTGDWTRAAAQLKIAASLDQGALLMGRIYADALACEEERRKIFAGKAAPTIFGRPQSWMAELCEALRLDCNGEHAAASTLRARAFEAAAVVGGRIDGREFGWIADADSRIGPMLEAIINGRYFWVPFTHLARVNIEAPSALRDQVWMPANFVFVNGGESAGLIPTRYAGSEESPDALIRLARKTEWLEMSPDTFRGIGQRMLTTDIDDFPLMDVRTVELSSLAATAANGADA